MKIISAVHIQGFRSISDETIDALSDHTVFIGKNSSGKSNVLRALNLFFNGEPSPNVPLEFERDLHYRPLRRQKKSIKISVTFSLPERFNFRKGLESLANLGSTFDIDKVWSLDRQRRISEEVSVSINGKEVEGGERIARDFLSLIVFRYIPNRTIPAELLRDESQAIAGVIFKKLKESAKASDVLKGLAESAARLLSSTSDALVDSGAPISRPNIATADSLGGMLRMSGFKAIGLNGANIRDEDWGAGHQAFFLLNLLREIDTDYSRQFGWRQASVWAVEEPESGLHHDLQTRLAKKFVDWSSDSDRRLQIFTTTHSPIISMAANCGYWIELGQTSSSLSAMDTTKLVRAAEEQGVSSYLHPLLSFPFHPVILVEGSNDEMVLNHVAQLVGRGILKFVTLPSVDSSESAGVDSIISYIKKNNQILARRSLDAPCIILLDWEVPDAKLEQLKKAYGNNSNRFVIKANTLYCRKELGRSFYGLERFYCPDVIRRAHEAGECTVAFPAGDGPWSIEKSELEKAKSRLAQRILNINDLSRLEPLVRVVEQAYEASVSYPSQQLSFL
jgi:predicted ATPase